MQIQGIASRSRGPIRCAISGAFLFAILAHAAWAALPSVVLTQLPGGVSAPVHVTNAHDGSGRLFVVEQPGTSAFSRTARISPLPFSTSPPSPPTTAASGACSRSPSIPTTLERHLLRLLHRQIEPRLQPDGLAVPRLGRPRRGRPGLGADRAPVVPHPTNTNHNGGQLIFGPATATSTSAPATAAAAAIRPTTPRTSTCCSARSCASTSTEPAPCLAARARPCRTRSRRAIPSSGVTGCDEIWASGCATRGASASTARPATCSSATSARTLCEEIDFQPAASTGGENYGWRKMEGFHCYNPPPCDDGTLTLPILEETHNPGGWCAIIGGYRYRGTAIPGLAGVYLYGDTCKGQVWEATEDAGSWTQQVLVPSSIRSRASARTRPASSMSATSAAPCTGSIRWTIPRPRSRRSRRPP